MTNPIAKTSKEAAKPVRLGNGVVHDGRQRERQYEPEKPRHRAVSFYANAVCVTQSAVVRSSLHCPASL
jgi:hypothetical protein